MTEFINKPKKFSLAKSDVVNGVLTLQQASSMYEVDKKELIVYIMETNEYDRVHEKS
jgi:hypothetical protein